MVLKPKVSICIPTYNGEAFLESALHSAIAQTYLNLEIVVSDDGSQDRTIAIVQSLQKDTSIPISFLQHERYGLVENWNFCLRHVPAETKYIKFLLQDDLLEPSCVDSMVAVAETDAEIGLVFSRRHVIYHQPSSPPTAQLPEAWQWLADLHQSWHCLKDVQQGLDLFADPQFLKQPDNKIGEPTNVLMRADVIPRIGPFDTSLRQYCDLEMWFRFMAHHKVAFIDRELATFRLHPHQATKANIESDRIWLEIYQLWLKLARDRAYANLPKPIRRNIYKHLIKSLMREYLRSTIGQKWHRLAQIHALIRSTFNNP